LWRVEIYKANSLTCTICVNRWAGIYVVMEFFCSSFNFKTFDPLGNKSFRDVFRKKSF